MDIKQALQEARDTGRRGALRAIAIRAGVSPSTVTRIVNGNIQDSLSDTHRRIKEAIGELFPTATNGNATKRSGRAGVGSK